MSDKSSESNKSGGIPGWLKAAVASLLSAALAAAATYASPLLDNVIKPGKPVANFQAQPGGLAVTFQNKTTGGHDGWWDFGDGSALEPFDPEQAALNHTYAKPGNYTVKLSVKNIINEENERTVTLALNAVDPTAPKIETFAVEAVRGNYTSSSFRVTTKVTNADLCVLSVGDKPLVFSKEMDTSKHPKTVTFDQPGRYIVRLAAYNGKQAVEKSEIVEVKAAPAGTMTATLAVSYDAVLVEQKVTNTYASLRYPPDQKGAKAVVPQSVPAEPGFEIIKADLAEPLKDPNIKLASLKIDPVKHDKVVVTCEISRPARPQAPAYTVPLALTEQRQSAPQIKTADPVSVNLVVPGSTVVPLPALPAGWVARSRQLTLAIQQSGKQVGFNGTNLPKNTAVQLPGGVFAVTAVEQAGGLLIDVKQVSGPGS